MFVCIINVGNDGVGITELGVLRGRAAVTVCGCIVFILVVSLWGGARERHKDMRFNR